MASVSSLLRRCDSFPYLSLTGPGRRVTAVVMTQPVPVFFVARQRDEYVEVRVEPPARRTVWYRDLLKTLDWPTMVFGIRHNRGNGRFKGLTAAISQQHIVTTDEPDFA